MRAAGLSPYDAGIPLAAGNRSGDQSARKRSNPMPLYLDVHRHVDGATDEAVAAAHQKDLETQAQYGVRYLRYWLDQGTGTIFCLVEAPSKEAAERVHREAHGLTADQIFEVVERS
jgi:hypothetical protein